LLAAPGSMHSQIFEVLKVAESAGWMHELLRAAADARPSRADLAELSGSLGLGAEIVVSEPPSEVPSVATASSGQERPATDTSWSLQSEPWREQLPAMEARVCRVEVGGGILGTGFLVGPDAVMTCHYVVEKAIAGEISPAAVRCRFDFRALADGQTEGLAVRLNPSDWLIDRDGAEPGQLDFAVLRLDRPLGNEPLNPSATGGALRGWIPLPAELPPLSAGDPLMILGYAFAGPLRLSLGSSGFIGFDESNEARVRYLVPTAPGTGGGPCFTPEWQLVAVHEKREPSSQPSDAEVRIGVSAAAIRQRMEKQGSSAVLKEFQPSQTSSNLTPEADSRPPKPGKIRDAVDPQKGRWGGKSNRKGRALHVELLEVGHTAFNFNAVVGSADGSPLVGPVVFHLHDSYPKSVVRVQKISEGNRSVLEDVNSYGVYTIGAQVKDAQGKWIGLEYNLCDLPELPPRFLSR